MTKFIAVCAEPILSFPVVLSILLRYFAPLNCGLASKTVYLTVFILTQTSLLTIYLLFNDCGCFLKGWVV